MSLQDSSIVPFKLRTVLKAHTADVRGVTILTGEQVTPWRESKLICVCAGQSNCGGRLSALPYLYWLEGRHHQGLGG
jgi:hypothetical protein